MELLRLALVITGIVLLVVAWFMGRRQKSVAAGKNTNLAGSNHMRKTAATTPHGYDPELDEVNLPADDLAINADQQAGHHDSQRGYQSDSDQTDAFLDGDEVDAAISSSDEHYDGTVDSEISNDRSFDEIDLDLDDDTDRSFAANSDSGRVTSFASAVKASRNDPAFGSVDDVHNDFSDEFEMYGEPVRLEEFEEKLVTVHVAAAYDRRFYGSDLKTLFEQHGYTFGRMSLYHCSLEGNKVFSIANMVKPGTFDQNRMSTFETPGITLFMRLPIKLDADVAFDFLIQEAKGLAEELDGHLRDGSRNPLSEQTIQHMREDIQQYVFRSKRVMQTS